MGLLLFNKRILFLILLAGAFCSKSMAQADTSFLGVWKGTSICQQKNSPCHDETVVYYITRNKNQQVEIRANKIVNGKEDEMGVIEFRYEEKTKEIVSVSQPNAVWRFKRTGDHLDGTLYVRNELFRIIKLLKD